MLRPSMSNLAWWVSISVRYKNFLTAEDLLILFKLVFDEFPNVKWICNQDNKLLVNFYQYVGKLHFLYVEIFDCLEIVKT